MARQMTPTQMVSQFRKWKVDLNLYPGWETRGYGPGSITDVEGIIVHHTGSDSQSDSYLKFLFVDGRGDVPPPLCNWSTDFDGDLWLGAAERANHAGMGSSSTLSKVEQGNYDWRNVEIRPGADNINGNTRYYGNEVRFDGGQPMTTLQYRTVILSCAAVCDFHDWGAWRVIGHREHTSRKPDPGSTLMYKVRRDVAAALAAGPGNWPTPQEVTDDMAGFTQAQLEAMMYRQNAEYGRNLWAAESGTGTALIKTVGGIATALGALSNKVDALAKQQLAEDVTDDAAFAKAMEELNTQLADLKASIPPATPAPKV